MQGQEIIISPTLIQHRVLVAAISQGKIGMMIAAGSSTKTNVPGVITAFMIIGTHIVQYGDMDMQIAGKGGTRMESSIKVAAMIMVAVLIINH